VRFSFSLTRADHLDEFWLLLQTQVVHAFDRHALDARKADRYIHVNRCVKHGLARAHSLTIHVKYRYHYFMLVPPFFSTIIYFIIIIRLK